MRAIIAVLFGTSLCAQASEGIKAFPQVGPAAGNPIQIENARPGTTDWQLHNPALAGAIEGFASAPSVAKGQRIDFLVNTQAKFYRIDVYRTGYYGGAGARLMATFDGLPGTKQKKPCVNAQGIIECDWTVGLTLSIPNTGADPSAADYWTSGIYLAKLTTDDSSHHDSYIIFVVRDDDRRPTYLVQLPITTYEAYNPWGGKSFYMGCGLHQGKLQECKTETRVDTVSFNRPFGISINEAAKYGLGAGEYVTNLQPVDDDYPISSAGFDVNLVRWIERKGYDVGYMTSMDLHAMSHIFDGTKAFISMGHDEYYSKPMWDNLKRAVDRDLNVGFFTANNIYWQVRFADGEFGSNKHGRLMTCYRKGGDPVRDNALTTGRFRDLGRPEASLIGSQYVFDPVQSDITIVNPHHWLLEGTGAAKNAELRGLLGYEVNAVDAKSSPRNLKILAHSTGKDYTSDVTYYVRPSYAQIFSTGTMQWSWGLDSFISNGLRADYASPVVEAITSNVFDALAERGLRSLTPVTSNSRLSTRTEGPERAEVVLAPANADGDKRDQWRILPDGGGSYSIIVSRAGGLCLEAFDATHWDRIGARDCDGSGSQKWQVIDLGDRKISLKNARSGQCLGSRRADRSSEGAIIAEQCWTGANEQLWRVRDL